jgi:hypothetical protein
MDGLNPPNKAGDFGKRKNNPGINLFEFHLNNCKERQGLCKEAFNIV